MKYLITKSRIPIILSLIIMSGFQIFAEAENSKAEEPPVIIVTGSKEEEIAEDAVEKVTVIDEEEIAEMGAKNVSEVLENSPGITITHHPMEGVSMQGLGASYVKILIDGVAVGGEIAGGVPVAAIPTSDIERIEIIQGASSALYGSDAMGGVINIITKKNKKKFNISTKQEMDIHKHYYGNLNFGYRNKIFSINGIASFDNTPGMITRELDAMGEKIDTYIVPANRMAYGRLFSNFFIPKGDLGIYGAYTNHIRFINQSENIANRFTTHKGEGGLKSKLDLNDSAQINLFSSYKFFNHFFDEVYTNYKDGNQKRRATNLNEIETEISGVYDFSISHSLLSGVNIKWGMMQGVDFLKPKHSLLMSIFSQYTWNLKGEDVFFLVPGFRIDWSPRLQPEDSHLWQATPKLSLRYNPTDNIALRLSYGMGFKVPTLKQKYWLFFHPAPVNFVLHGNPALKPETSNGINASIEYSPIKGLKFGSSGYFNFVKNLIFAEEIDKRDGFYPDSNGNLRAVTGQREYTNIDKVITTGGSFFIQYNNKWIETQLAYTIANMFNYNTETKKFFQGAYFVPHQIKWTITGIIPVSLTRISLKFNWDAPQLVKRGFDVRAANMIKTTDTNYEKSPDKLIINLHISQKFWKERIEIYTGVKNMLNNLHFKKGTNGKTQKDYYGLIEGVIAYFGLGIKY